MEVLVVLLIISLDVTTVTVKQLYVLLIQIVVILIGALIVEILLATFVHSL